ncbi:MAG: hypothetical protein LJE63_03405 [Desulfobacteraceae bacterium]|nr:hypothetical protein [Desulfobacteraceae bacterium]
MAMLLLLWFLAGAVGWIPVALAGTTAGCGGLQLEPRAPAYYIYPEYVAVCPRGGAGIRCYRYHWDWVCEKGDTLYWDRRLEAAAHAACGCPPPAGVASASPAVSAKPRETLFGGARELSNGPPD